MSDINEEIEKKEFYQSEHQKAINNVARLLQEKNKVIQELESQKAITEIAVKALERIKYSIPSRTWMQIYVDVNTTLEEIKKEV